MSKLNLNEKKLNVLANLITIVGHLHVLMNSNRVSKDESRTIQSLITRFNPVFLNLASELIDDVPQEQTVLSEPEEQTGGTTEVEKSSGAVVVKAPEDKPAKKGVVRRSVDV